MNDQDVLHETWSLPGALARVSERPEADLGAPRDALWGISGVIPDASLEHWNDPAGRSQEEMLTCSRAPG